MKEISINYVDDYLEDALNRNLITSEKERFSSLEIFVKWNYQDSRAEHFRILLKEIQKLFFENDSGSFLYLILLRKFVEPVSKSQKHKFHKSKIIDFLLEKGIEINSPCSEENYHDLPDIEYYSVICKFRNDNFEDVLRILELLPHSFIVASKSIPCDLSKSSVLTQRIKQKDNWWFEYSSLNSILSYEKDRILIRLHGSFDDTQTSLICIGKSEAIKQINYNL